MRWRLGLLIVFVVASVFTSSLVYGAGDFGDLESGISVGGSKDIDTVVGNEGLVGFIAVVINIVLGVIIGLGLIVFVIGGFVYMMAGGDAGKLGTAKTIMGAALLGIVLAIAAQLILNTLSPQFAEKIINPELKL